MFKFLTINLIQNVLLKKVYYTIRYLQNLSHSNMVLKKYIYLSRYYYADAIEFILIFSNFITQRSTLSTKTNKYTLFYITVFFLIMLYMLSVN